MFKSPRVSDHVLLWLCWFKKKRREEKEDNDLELEIASFHQEFSYMLCKKWASQECVNAWVYAFLDVRRQEKWNK